MGFGEHLLARQHHGVFHGGVEVAAANLRRVRPRGFQKIGQDAIDLHDFQANIFHYRARRAGRGQIAADDFDDAGDSGQRVANLVGQARGQFAERRQVLGARHLGAMQDLNFFPALAQLLHHVVEVAAEVSDFVVAPAKLTSTSRLPSLTSAIFSCNSTMGR
jgi:hypothetical protein